MSVDSEAAFFFFFRVSDGSGGESVPTETLKQAGKTGVNSR